MTGQDKRGALTKSIGYNACDFCVGKYMNGYRTAKTRAKGIGAQRASDFCLCLRRTILKAWEKPSDSTVLGNNNDGGGIRMDGARSLISLDAPLLS